jgi:hypothetical protein
MINTLRSQAECLQTVVSDRRKITITAAGDTMVVAHPIKITDTAGAVWTVKTDDGATAVFTSP